MINEIEVRPIEEIALTDGITTDELNIDTIWENIKNNKSRDEQMLLFDDLRIALGGAAADWGTKVYFKTLEDIHLIKLCVAEGKAIKKCPTDEAFAAKPEYFYYDADNDIWGFNGHSFEQIKEEVFPAMHERAIEVREQFREEAERKRKASQVANRSGRIRLF